MGASGSLMIAVDQSMPFRSLAIRGENAITSATIAQSGGIGSVLNLGHAGYGCLNPHAVIACWFNWPLQAVINATSDSEAGCLDRYVKKVPLLLTPPAPSKTISNRNIDIAATCLYGDGRFELMEGSSCH